MNYDEKIEQIKVIAQRHNYNLDKHVLESKVLIFKNKNQTINVWYSKMTVGTAIKHPKHENRRQLYRRNVTFEELNSIFANPRVHTDKGYFQKKTRDWKIKKAKKINKTQLKVKKQIRERKKEAERLELREIPIIFAEKPDQMPENMAAGKAPRKISWLDKIVSFLFN